VNTYSYIRSNRAVEMRVQDGLSQDIIETKAGDMDMVKKLNGFIAELDGMNKEKRQLSE